MSLLVASEESTPLTKLFSLEGKVVVVTGGNRGIGLAICQGYSEAGAAGVALVHSADKTAALAEQRARELEQTYPKTKAKAYKANVAISEEIEGVMQNVFNDFGRLDVVVANAGVYSDTPALEMKPDEAQYVTEVNHLGALYTAQAAARIMKENGGGKIIFTASLNGRMVLRPQLESIYCATKAAVLHLTRALAVEWAKFNIQVNSVSPGYIDTEMNDIMIQRNPDRVKNWLGDCPAGRFCKVWELKGIYLFLASQASSYVTGSDYLIDGGHTCH